MSDQPRIGMYLCHCVTNIAGVIDIKKLLTCVERLPNLPAARDYTYMCSNPGQQLIRKDVHQIKINRVVVAACPAGATKTNHFTEEQVMPQIEHAVAK